MTDTIDTTALRAAIRGEVVAAGDERWDIARQAFNLAVDQQPAAVAFPDDAADVAALLGHARAEGLRVAPQCTGHNAGSLASLDRTILVKTSSLADVELDAGARRARVGAGTRWGGVVPGASDRGLAALAGSAPGVGVVGYTLAGGMGWLARRHGLACNSVASIDVVTVDGAERHVDATSEPDLFWALRGAGGAFGVVTGLEVELFDVPEIHAGAFFWPIERASDVLRRWLEVTAELPEEVTSLGRLLQFPPFPEIPEPMRGKAFVVVEAACLLDEEQAAPLLAPLRELEPAMDTFATIPPAGLTELHMDPPDPVPGASGHLLLDGVTPETFDAILEVAGPGTGSPLVSLEVRQTGGALGRREEGAGALAALDGTFSIFAVGAVPTPDLATAVGERVTDLTAALAPWGSGQYLNFTESATDASSFFGHDVIDRLREVKASHDPDDVLVSAISLPPAA